MGRRINFAFGLVGILAAITLVSAEASGPLIEAAMKRNVVVFSFTLAVPDAFAQELDAQLPNEEGWRGVRWGMTVQEVTKVFGSALAEDKRSAKDKAAKTVQRGHLKSKVP